VRELRGRQKGREGKKERGKGIERKEDKGKGKGDEMLSEVPILPGIAGSTLSLPDGLMDRPLGGNRKQNSFPPPHLPLPLWGKTPAIFFQIEIFILSFPDKRGRLNNIYI